MSESSLEAPLNTDANPDLEIAEKRSGFLRRHKLGATIGAFALILGTGYVYVRGQEQYAEDNCTDMKNVQVDVSAGLLSTAARTIKGRWAPGSLRSVADHVSETRGYFVSEEEVVKLNQKKYGQFADNELAPGVYCLALPLPQTEKVGDFTFVQRNLPDNLKVLTTKSDGSADPAMLAAIARANADGWAANDLEQLPDVGQYPIDTDFLSWVSEQPAITKEAINRTKEQAQELGLIG